MTKLLTSRWTSWMKSGFARYGGIAVAFTALIYGYVTNDMQANDIEQQNVELRLQNERIEAQNVAIKDQAERQRFGLCGLQYYLAAPPNPQATESNLRFREVIGALTGPQSLSCSPDPLDGK